MRSVCIVLFAAFFCGCGSPAARPEAPDTPDASLTWATVPGADDVATRGCRECHQSPNLADGVLSGQTTPRPGTRVYGRNLTPDEETGLGSWTDDAVMRAMRSGVDDQGESLCAPMPRFADMSDDEARRIVAYLRSLPPVHREIPEGICEADDGDLDAGRDDGPDTREHGGHGDSPARDAGTDGAREAPLDAGECTFVPPNEPASCHGCSDPSACHANGCYGVYYCDPKTATCHRRPAACE